MREYLYLLQAQPADELVFKNLFTVEVIAMGVLLLAILLIGLIILVKMKPLQSFSEIKLGKFELKKSPQDAERDRKQDDALSRLLEASAGVERRIDGIDCRLKEIDGRLDVHYGFIREAAVKAANGVVWSDRGAPFEETVQAGLFNLMLGQNTNLVERMIEVIMGYGKNGVQTYNSIFNRFVLDNKEKLTGNSHFWGSIEDIKRSVK